MTVRLPPPCPWCGQIERDIGKGVYKITHDYELHPKAPVKEQFGIWCKLDGRRLANVPEPMLWTGVVERIPEDPEDLAGLTYLPCETCRKAKKPHWHRFEIIPPNPVVKITVPVILDSEAA